MAERTPGPWTIDAGFLVAPTTPGASSPPYFPLYEMDRIVGSKAADKADRAFIVRACNAHDDLVAALEGVLPLAEAWADGKTGSHPDHEWIEVARAALAKAEAL